MNAGEVLRALRTINGYDTIAELSDATQISKGTLSKAENGKRGIPSYVLRTLADLYEIPFPLFILAFRKLDDLNYDSKKDRKKAYQYLLSLNRSPKK